jgi:hypothetical protein
MGLIMTTEDKHDLRVFNDLVRRADAKGAIVSVGKGPIKQSPKTQNSMKTMRNYDPGDEDEDDNNGGEGTATSDSPTEGSGAGE